MSAEEGEQSLADEIKMLKVEVEKLKQPRQIQYSDAKCPSCGKKIYSSINSRNST